jgi:hypothetical protein
VPAGLYPALHDGVHARHPDTALHDLESGVGEQCVEGGGELGVAVADEELGLAACVFEVHYEVASELHDPLSGGVCGGAQDSDAPGGVLDDGEDVQVCPGQGAGLEEVAGEQGAGLAAQEVGPGGALAFRSRWDAVLLEDLPDGGRGDLDTQGGEFAVDASVPPGTVLPGEAQDQGADRADGGWSSAPLGRAGRGMAPFE